MPMNHGGTFPDDFPVVDGQDHEMSWLGEIGLYAFGANRFVENVVGDAIEYR